MTFMKTSAAAAALALAFAAPASAITYTVDLAFGGGSVMGTVETDGTIGTLGTSNFVDWNLHLSDGTTMFTLIGNGSVGDNSNVLVSGTSVGATASELTFDFTDTFGLILFQAPSTGSGETWFCIENNGCTGGSPNAFSVNPTTSHGSYVASPVQSGVVTWATTNVSAVPLPASGLMLIAAVAGVAGLRRKKAA